MPTSGVSFDNILSNLEESSAAEIFYGTPYGTPSADRRCKVRYPLDLSVRFHSLSGRPSFSGVGRTVNMSSSGVLVVWQHGSQHDIIAGARMEISIEWPSLLDGRIPLQLVAVGRVRRVGASVFAATLERHQFRTVGSARQPLARLGSNLVEWPPCKVAGD